MVSIQRIAYLVLLFEGITNMAIFGPLIYVFPDSFGIRIYLPEGTQVDETSRAFSRMCGGMISTLGGYVLFQAMRKGGELEDVVLSAFFVGDFLYVGAFFNWVYHMNFWNVASVFNVVLGLIYPVCRVIHLYDKWVTKAGKNK